jgi:hemolysin D
MPWHRKNNSPQKIRHRQELEFLPAALEIMETPPSRLSRAATITIITFATFAIAWSLFARMDVVVSATGRVVPSGKIKVIQAAEGGVVRAIHVRDGQQVRRGEVLIELDATTTEADHQRLSRELAEARLDVARLQAQLKGDPATFAPPANVSPALVSVHRDLLASRLHEQTSKLAALADEIRQLRAERAALRNEVAKLEQTLPLQKERLSKLEAMADGNFISEFELIGTRLEVIEKEKGLDVQRDRLQVAIAALAAAKRKLEHSKAEFRSRALGELSEAAKRRDAAAQEIIKADQRKALQKLRAPVNGVVQQLAVNTVGGVVTPAQKLMVVVPAGTGLEVEAQILNKDIGFIEQGQPVSVKVETYEFTRHGMLEGSLQWVATDAVVDEHMGPVYPVRIALSNTRMPNRVNGRQGHITPGMSVISDIVVSKRRVIEYFLGPILRYRDESLREL